MNGPTTGRPFRFAGEGRRRLIGSMVVDSARHPAGSGAPAGVNVRHSVDAPSAKEHAPRPGRRRMIDTARQLFCAGGYGGTPLRAVSDALGVT